MKVAMILLSGAAVLALVQAAEAAPPKVSGKYVFMSWESCEASFSTSKDAQGDVSNVNPGKTGLAAVGLGTITFPSVAASSGNATVSNTIFEGGTLRINNSGFNTKQINGTFTAPFEVMDTTFKIGDDVFAMQYGNVANGVARTIYLARKQTVAGNANCVHAISATKQ